MLLDRRVVTGTLVVAAATVAIGLVVPQAEGTAATSVSGLGLDHVFTGWWFRAVVIVITAQLTVATARLVARDMRRVRRGRGPASPDPTVVLDARTLSTVLQKTGYLRVRRSVGSARYVKHLWGYAGPALLHAGMLAAILAVLANSLILSSGQLKVTEGQSVTRGTPLEAPRHGPLAAAPALPETLRFEAIAVTYWPGGQPRSMAGTYSVVRPGVASPVTVVTNEPVTVAGMRFFQSTDVGYSYGVTLGRGTDTVEQRLLELPLPASASEPSYLDTELENGDLLRAKVVHDPTVPGGAPVLTLRLMRGGDIVGEQSFDSTGTAMLGDTSVSVDVATRWSILVLERTRGMGLLFASFFAILAGALLIYGATPRELTLVKHDDGTVTADWHAVRFARLYANEERMLREAATGTKEGGSD